MERVPIHFAVSASGTYDSSLLLAAVDSSGEFRPLPSYGTAIDYRVTGQRRWRNSYLGISYGGNYAHFANNTGFNGANQNIGLGYGRRMTRKLEFFSQVSAATSNMFVGGLGPYQTETFEFMAVPEAELFNSRIYSLGNSTGLIYYLNRNDSIRVTGTGTTIRRKSRALADVNTYGASGDWVHRLGRRTSMGVSYTFVHYDFKQVFGESDIHLFGLNFARQIGRNWQFNLAGRAARQQTVGVRSVQLDPVLAALLGRTSGREVFESDNLLYGGSVEIRRTMRHSTLSLRAERGITPGNGFFLTSVSETAAATFDHAFSRRWNASLYAGLNRFSSLGFASGKYKGWSSGAAGGYRVSENFGVNVRVDWRTFQIERSTFSRSGVRITAGVTYSPRSLLK
jgi:hypothetical protein